MRTANIARKRIRKGRQHQSSQAVRTFQEAQPAIGFKIAYITDPAGVYIELTEGYAKY